VLRMKSDADCMLEVKLIDKSGSVYGRNIPLTKTANRWTTYILKIKPEWVRFAWHETAEPNLMNKEGLPANVFPATRERKESK